MPIEVFEDFVKEIRRKYFGIKHEWCELSEKRLLSKLVQHKPTGIQRHQNINSLVDYMNHIYEDELDTNFEEYLSEKDLEVFRNRKLNGVTEDIMSFPPIYSIRPNGKQVEEMLNDFYDLDLIHESATISEKLTIKDDFQLPQTFFTQSRTSVESSPHAGFLSLIMSDSKSKPTSKKRKQSEEVISSLSRSSTPSSKRSKIAY